MKKTILILILIPLVANVIFSQPVQPFNYQALARDNSGNILPNLNVSFRISILKGSPTGVVMYIENFETVSDPFGLVKLEIGYGSVEYGVFEELNFSNHQFFLKIEMDEDGGANFLEMGTMSLLAVPYALHANSLTLMDLNGNLYNVEVDSLGNLFAVPQHICGDSLLDDRDGQKYATVQIGTQCWMSENLNIGIRIDGTTEQSDNDTIEKYCYNDMGNNCTIYGGLYKWDEMMQYIAVERSQGICPEGWHIPCNEEWKQLEGEADSQFGYPDPEWNNVFWRGFDAGKHLKSTDNWYGSNNGDDLFGFTVIPGGYYDTIYTNCFNGLGYLASFWTSTIPGTDWIYWRNFSYSHDDVYSWYYIDNRGYSVRCIKN